MCVTGLWQIARANGIPPLVSLLDFDDGTEQTFIHAAEALARLALNDEENQAQIAKRLVVLLGSDNVVAKARALPYSHTRLQVPSAMAALHHLSPLDSIRCAAGALSACVVESGVRSAKQPCRHPQRRCSAASRQNGQL
jgi:hypothetical protein